MKKTFIYLLRTENEPNYKIGITNDICNRIKNLQTGNPEKIIILEKIEVKNGSKVEKSIHNHYKHLKMEGEWFSLTISDELNFKNLVLKQDEIFTFLEENII